MNSREIVISRVQRELIGPGSDLFECSDKINFTDEIIADKPLNRYYSGILYPKKESVNDIIDDDDEGEENDIDIIDEDIPIEENEVDKDKKVEPKDDNKEVRYSASTFFPSKYGISFVISSECKEICVKVSFGTYKKAKVKDIAISYAGDNIELLEQYGLSEFIEYDGVKKTLKFKKEIKREEKKMLYPLGKEHRDSILYKTLTKLFFKDKYRRYDNKIETRILINDIIESENKHYKILLSEIPDVDSSLWKKDKKTSLKDNLWLHIKLYKQPDNNSVIKVFINNTLLFPKEQFSIAKENLNQACLFQTEIKVETPCLLPFNAYRDNLYKSEENRMLDFLYRKKISYGIGHNTACIWENHEDDNKKPQWISSTFFPQYNVKSQSTNIPSVDKRWLDIKGLSEFNDNNKNEIISNLKKLSYAYLDWIEEEEKSVSKLNDVEKELGKQNIEKCISIQSRMQNGIELLENNPNALRAFKLANTAIYLQMFQNQWHFNSKKDGFDAYERENEELQYLYKDYATKEYPDKDRIPTWRPFQLAFILQCLPSFIEEYSTDRDLVDLLYFPTGGGKTEAYLALSAFLIFWRRLEYPKTYGGVNIIIRYTLRLLSAQQFERATKLILACEFIRRNHKDLGDEKVTIGFWVGKSTIPNDIKDAKKKLEDAQKRLNSSQNTINPFQLSNCQWCNTKIISKTKSENEKSQIGHRLNTRKELISYCLNEKCIFSEGKEELPIVLIDEDIYKKPPTILFATVDKFAQLAWKGESTNLFNYKNNRKPELIIQDELHLLNGPLKENLTYFKLINIELLLLNSLFQIY